MLILVEESMSNEKRSAEAEVSGFCDVHGVIMCGTFFSIIFYTVATNCGLDGPGSNPVGDRDFPLVQTGPGAHPASCKMGTGGKLRPGRATDHSPPSSGAGMEE